MGVGEEMAVDSATGFGGVGRDAEVDEAEEGGGVDGGDGEVVGLERGESRHGGVDGPAVAELGEGLEQWVWVFVEIAAAEEEERFPWE